MKSVPWSTLGRSESNAEMEEMVRSQRHRVPLLEKRPLFSIVTLGYDTEAPLVQSLQAQSYPHWELLVVGSARLESEDSRVRGITSTADSEGAAFKIGKSHACGEWVSFLSTSDVLSPIGLFSFAVESEKHPSSDLLYAHEVHLDHDYRTILRHFSKSEYSWFNLLHFNILGRPHFIKKHTLERIQFDAIEFERDLAFKLSEETENWSLIPAYLGYRVGQSEESVFHQNERALTCVEAHGARKGFAFRSLVTPHSRVIEPTIDADAHLISVIICFRNRAQWTVRCLEALQRVRGKVPLQVILVNNQSDPLEREEVACAAVRPGLTARVIDDDKPFNFGRMNNEVVRRHAEGDLIFFLNNDVFLETLGGLDQLASWAVQDGVGVVGMCLRYPHGGVQHAGFRAIFGGQARMARMGHDYLGNAFAGARREVFGNTFAACMVKRSVFETVGGLRAAEFPNGFGDVAFNFECHHRGFHNLYLGDVSGIHLESASRGLSYEYWEEVEIEREYPEILQKMLRADVGFDLVPRSDLSPGMIKELTLGTLYRRFPRLLAWRLRVKRMLGRAKASGSFPAKNINLPVGECSRGVPRAIHDP